jgi:uncharacterized protein (TIRG00374 family)
LSLQRKAHIASVIISVLFLAVIISRVDLAKLAGAFGDIDWAWVVGVFILNLVNTGIEAYRWRLIVSSVKKEVRTRNTFAAMLAGVVGNTVLPLKLGDGARAYFLAKREEISMTSSLAMVMLDRIMDITLFLVLVVLVSLVFNFPRFIERASVTAGVAVAVAIVVSLLLMAFKRRMELRLTGRIGMRVMGYIHRFTIGLVSLRQAGILMPTALLSVLSWGMRILMIDFMFRAFGFELPGFASSVVLIFTNLGIAAVGTPANLGGFELAALAALKLFGIETERALSCAMVFHAVEVVPMVLLGLVVISLSGISSREVLESSPPP